MRRKASRVIAVGAAALLLVAVSCRSGVTTGVGVDAEARTITLGELSPFTGPVAVIGNPLTRGHEVYFQYVNEVLGGVGKDLDASERYKVVLEKKDTQYTPAGHRQQYTAIKDKVLMIAQSLGTPTTKAILQDVNEDKILTGAATLASAWLKEKYVIPAGAPYPIQFINAGQYLKDQGVTPKIGVIYQEDDYGLEGLNGVKFIAEKFGWTIAAEATYKAADAAGEAALFVPAVKKMKDAGATHVFLTSTPTVTGKVLGVAASVLRYSPQWIGQSPSYDAALLKTPVAPVLQASYWTVTDAQCAWGETGSNCPGMKELIDNVKRFAPDQAPNYYFIFGYTQARIVHQILEKAVADGDLTREGVVNAFESLKDVDMGGLLNPISYGSTCEDKIPVTASTIWSIDPKEPIGLKRLAASVDSPEIDSYPFCT